MQVEGQGSYLPLRVGVDQSFLSTIRNVTPDLSGGSSGSFEFLDAAGVYAKGRWAASGPTPTEIRSVTFTAMKDGDATTSMLACTKPLSKTRTTLQSFLAKSTVDRLASERRNLAGADTITGGQMSVNSYDGGDRITTYFGKTNLVRSGLGDDRIEIGLTQLVVPVKQRGAGGDFYGEGGVDQWVIGDYQTNWGPGKVVRIKDYEKGETVTIDNELYSWGSTPLKTPEGWVYFQNLNHPDTRIVFEGVTNPADIAYTLVAPLM